MLTIKFLFCLVALLACTLGKICGMGGGVIIKPVLDAFGLLSVEAINFVPLLLLGMIFCGILGSELGSRLNKRLNEKMATTAFEAAMLLVMGISVYNFYQFLFR